MTASSDFDCYLCGAQNDATADHCARCNGQLLRIPSDTVDDTVDDATSADLVDEAAAEAPAEAEVERKRNRRKLRKGTVQEQRLSDALGLPPELIDAEEDPEDPLIETVVTSIPRATPSADIPLLGTRAGAIPQAALKDSEFGRNTYILLFLLVLATGWLGYSTLTGSSSQPDSIAFTGTTTTSSTSTTTTEAPRNVLPEETILSLFRDAFVRVEIYECVSEVVNELEREPILETAGISIDTNNVMVGSTTNIGSGVAFIRPRLSGTGRVALLTRTPDGTIATSLRGTSNHLRLNEDVLDTPEQTHFVTFDLASRQAAISATAQGTIAEIEASDTGDAQTLTFNGRGYPTTPFIDFDRRVERIPETDIPPNAQPCQALDYLQHEAIAGSLGEQTDEATSPFGSEGDETEGVAKELEGQ